MKGTKRDTGLKLGLLADIAKYFDQLRRNSFEETGLIDPLSQRIDPTVLVHQIPGGMISNLISQLREQNALDKLDEALKEVPRVRRDLGYPPLVTPTSQIVGSQAVMNVMSGERYRIVSKEVKDYVRGLYGKHPSPITAGIRRRIIGNEEIATCRPADLLPPEMKRMAEEAQEFARREEDVLTYALFPQAGKEFLENKRGDKLGERTKTAAIAVALVHQQSREQLVNRAAQTDSAWRLAGRLGHVRQDPL